MSWQTVRAIICLVAVLLPHWARPIAPLLSAAAWACVTFQLAEWHRAWVMEEIHEDIQRMRWDAAMRDLELQRGRFSPDYPGE